MSNQDALREGARALAAQTQQQSALRRSGEAPDAAVAFLKRWSRGGASLYAKQTDPDTGAEGAFESKAFTREELDDEIAADWIQTRQGKSNLYFAANTLIQPNGGRKKSNVKSVDTLQVDVDIPTGANQQEAMAKIVQLLLDHTPEPSVVFATGGGAQAFWRLETPIVINGDETRAAEVEAYSRQLAIDLGGKASGADAVHSVEHIFRLPGTMNIPNAKKRAKGRRSAPARLVQFTDALYQLSDFAAAEPEKLAPTASTPVSVDQGNTASLTDDEFASLPVKVRAFAASPPPPDGERSERQFAMSCEMVRASVPDQLHFRALIDTQLHGLSSCILLATGGKRRPNAEKYARKQVERAHKVEASQERRAVATASGIPVWRDCDDDYGLEPLPTLRNSVIAIEALGVVCRHDIFHESIIVEYGGEQSEIQTLIGELTDHRLGAIRSLIDKRFRIDMGDANVYAAVREIARDHAFHPVRDYLDECEAKWDGVERINKLAITHFGAEDTPLNRAQFRKVFIASVRRIRQPGVKFDNILTLESDEGTGKSTAVEILYGSDNFSDQTLLGLGDREVQERLAGVWGFEIAELAGMSRAEVERVKSQTTRTEDRARPAYGRTVEKRKRTCVLWASTNNQHYLKSQTGNRRFWPVAIGAIDLEGLSRDRDQLWAEAATLETSGESLMLDKAFWADAAAAQEQRREVDPWEDTLSNIPEQVHDGVGPIQILFRHDGEIRVSSAALLTFVLKVPAGQQHGAMGTRLATVMKRLGWQRPNHRKLRINGEAVSGFQREDLCDLTSGTAGDVAAYVQSTLPGIGDGVAS